VEGIFRLSGGAEAVRQLKKIIDNSDPLCPLRLGSFKLANLFWLRFVPRWASQGKDTWSIPFPDEPSTGPHVVASLLKLYRSPSIFMHQTDYQKPSILASSFSDVQKRFMKELPEPLVPNEYYEPFLTRQKVAWPTYTSRLVAPQSSK